MITQKVLRTITENDLIQKKDHIVVGLSGGPDSVCLFYLLYQIRQEFDLTLHAVHVNHQFRPGAAEEDQKYVEELCRGLAIPCHTFTYDCKAIAKEQGISSEEAGRNARYRAFYQVAENLPGRVKIAVAHNAGDQAETVLIRLLRGTGTDGLAGMEYKRTGEGDAEIIRPLLDTDRREIEAYCLRHDLKPRIDLTNLQSIYTRNKVRLELIPFIEEHFHENITEALNRLSKIAREDKAYLWNRAGEAFADARIEKGVLDCEKLRPMEPAIRHRVILKAFEEMGLYQDITATHLWAADHLISQNRTSSSVNFPKDYILSVSYGRVFAGKKAEPIVDLPAPRLTSLVLSKADWIAQESARRTHDNTADPHWAAFDWDKLRGQPEPLLRTRRPGDRIGLAGMEGRKKVQDFMVDQKIPRAARDQVLLVAIGGEILWIIGDVVSGRTTGLTKGKISREYGISKETENILLLELQIKL